MKDDVQADYCNIHYLLFDFWCVRFTKAKSDLHSLDKNISLVNLKNVCITIIDGIIELKKKKEGEEY